MPQTFEALRGVRDVQNIGPSTTLPLDWVTPDVLLCLGEEYEEWDAALLTAGLGRADGVHRHRAFTASVRKGILCLAGSIGSASVEKCLWDLLTTGRVRRIVLVGTAGNMPASSALMDNAYVCSPAQSRHQNFDAPGPMTWEPSWMPDLPRHAIVSSDRFYGFSPLVEGPYPGEPALQQAWAEFRDADVLIDMEVAAFYHYCQAFGPADLLYVAIKAPANHVGDLDSMPDLSAPALDVAVHAGVAALRD